MFLDFIPFGYYYGDTEAANWINAYSSYSVSNNFPLFTEKNHQKIYVSNENQEIKK